MSGRKTESTKEVTKRGTKSRKTKPPPTEVGPTPSTNGEAIPPEPFDTPTRSFYISAAQVKEEKLTMLWAPYIPENFLTLVTGDSQAGKSTILSALAAGMTRGMRLHNSGGHPQGRVLVFSPEEPISQVVKPRLNANNANMQMVFFGDYGTDGKLLPRIALPADCGKLCERIKIMHIRLVIIDPITAYLGSGFNGSADQDVRSLLDLLSQMATEAQCTFLISRHYRKSTEGSPLDRIGGSAAWGHYPRTVLACGFDPDDPDKRILAVSKTSLGGCLPSLRYDIVDHQGSGKLILGAASSITARDLGIAGMLPSERDALEDAIGFLKDALADGEKPANDLKAFALKNMISEATLRRAKKKLNAQSKLIVSAGERYHVWLLPEKTATD